MISKFYVCKPAKFVLVVTQQAMDKLWAGLVSKFNASKLLTSLQILRKAKHERKVCISEDGWREHFDVFLYHF